MSDALYHALGLCGEHWHPNLINVSLVALLVLAADRTTREKA